ncbi:hypothetical protein M404DRAFT_796100 [Pisolithus tinctorius Marx 270]|uniref:Uncharacterized protein n=1 Tax=Pisolithus tinctorius Marx 270 TaxID=870435 RepID=A0A0C3KPZ2_PISTI|nr:hypothetical protein M404DRAFT_796100 [Pisolithus tinctorius Marx 270]
MQVPRTQAPTCLTSFLLSAQNQTDTSRVPCRTNCDRGCCHMVEQAPYDLSTSAKR